MRFPLQNLTRSCRPIRGVAVACRCGFTLVEIAVTIAVMAAILVVSLPAVSNIFEVEQKAAIRELGQTYSWLMDEAALRNVTFRVVINLDRNTWKVEVGDPDTMVFSTPEAREQWEEERDEERASLTERELQEELEIIGYSGPDEDALSAFEGLDDPIFNTEQALPDGIRFDYVYTPQYGPDGLFPNDEAPENADEEAIAYTYIFANGTAEHTIIRIVNVDGEDGQSLEVNSLNGTVRITHEIIDPETLLDWVPEEAPTLQ